MNPDQTTYDYLKGRECVPEAFEEAVADWKTLVSDDDAVYDKVIRMDVSDLAPMVTWGNQSCMGVDFDSSFPEIKDMNDERAYHYMDLEPGQKPEDIELGYIFIGSCTNARLSDLQLARDLSKGRRLLPI